MSRFKGFALLISIESHLVYSAQHPFSLLLQIEAAQGAAQTCITSALTTKDSVAWSVISGEEDIGTRRWGTVHGRFECTYSAQISVDRLDVRLEALQTTPLALLPSDVTKFLMPSRYCHPKAFLEFVPKQFGNLSGGPLIAAMAAWIEQNFT